MALGCRINGKGQKATTYIHGHGYQRQRQDINVSTTEAVEEENVEDDESITVKDERRLFMSILYGKSNKRVITGYKIR
jgi:hypothetical protein